MPFVDLHKTAEDNTQHKHVAERTFWCTGWLQERLENLYKKDPGYSDKAASLFMLDLQSPQELPDNLRGEQWNFVQLPLSALLEELSQVKQVRNLPKSIGLTALLIMAFLIMAFLPPLHQVLSTISHVSDDDKEDACCHD